MDEKRIFSILELEITKDENQIKDAYRKILVRVNPEDDPEGFKQLRQAYEEAIQYARREEKENIADTSPVGIWIGKVEQTYCCLSTRMDLNLWKQLFSEDLCQNLDTSVEARDGLLSFLSEHFRLKNNIWRLINDTFLIKEEKEELIEKFPENFINFVLRHCEEEDEDDFPFELFEGEDNGDYDKFLYEYAEIARNIDEEQWEEAQKCLNNIQSLSIHHPLLDLEVVRYKQGCGNEKEAVDQIRGLLLKYSSSLRMLALGADILWKAGEIEEAAGYFEQAVERVPLHYLANKRLSRYYLKKDRFREAKNCCEKVLGSGEEELLEDRKQINDKIIEENQKDRGEGSDIKRILESGWCCLENGYGKKGIEFLCNEKPLDENKAEHANLLGRLYLMDKQYNKAIEYTQIRLALIKKEAAQEEKQENDIRSGTAYELWALAYIGKAEEDEKEKDNYYKLAVENLEKALEYDPLSMRYLFQKAKICLLLEEFQKVVDTCDKMEEVEPGNFWTYVYYQEAFYGLHKAQEVIDYFYRAKEIYAYYPKMYELVAQVFLDYEQIKDVKGILDQAKEMKVTSNKLDIIEVKYYRFYESEGEEDAINSLEFADEIRKKLIENKADKEEIAEILSEMARCCHNKDMLQEGLDHIQTALKFDKKPVYYWIAGNIYLDLKKYTKALECYAICEDTWSDSEMVLERIAYCYKETEDGDINETYEKSYIYYKKVLEINPDNRRANDANADVCRNLYIAWYDDLYYRDAMGYLDHLLEIDQENAFHHYNTKGRINMDKGEWDLSLADLEKATEVDPSHPIPYMNIGCVYKYMGEFEKALAAFEKAAELSGKSPSLKIYGNLGDCYERMGNKEKAVEMYLKNLELFPGNQGTVDDIVNIYNEMGQYNKAIKILEKAYEKGSKSYFKELASIYLNAGEITKGIYTFKKVLSKEREDVDALEGIGDAYYYFKNKPLKAINYYENALKSAAQKSSKYRGLIKVIMEIYFTLGRFQETEKYFVLYMESLEAENWGTQGYFNKKDPYMASRLQKIASVYLYSGRIEKAKEYLGLLKNQEKCRSCVHGHCYEIDLLEVLIAEYEGNKEKALMHLKKAEKECPTDWFCRMKLKALQK